MSLTRIAVRRPVTTLMISLIVVLLGWMSLSRLSIALMPEITWPTISVTTLYEGAGPAVVEERITRPLEQTLQSVHGVEQVYSSSIEGSSHVRVRFRWGANLDTAISDMRAKIEKMRKSLPDGVDPPSIRRYDTSDSPILYLALSADLDPIPMTRLAEKDIAPRLENVDGVARVRVRGGARREIQIKLNRIKLEALNMTVGQVVDVIRKENVSQPAGNFEQGNQKLLIRSRGDYHSLEQIADTIIRESEGAVVRVGDVAEVIDGEEERMERTRVNGKPGLMLYVYMQAGANSVAVSDRVRTRVEEINRSLPNAQLGIRIDRSQFIRQSISNVRMSALYGMGLAVVVLIVFLRSFRSTLIIGISMPLSVLATFGMIYFKGFTLNMISFGGLALGMGLLVDNSIVVLESIFRKLEDGLDSKQAAIDGTHEVASAILASTLTTLVVFIPLLFFTGMTGLMLKQLAWVVSFSLVCSLFASLTLTPVLAAYWIRRAPAASVTVDATSIQRFGHKMAGAVHDLNRRLFAGVERAYGAVLGLCLKYAGVVGILLFACFSIVVGLAPRVGTEFMPKADESGMYVIGRMAPGIQLETLDAQTKLVEAGVRKVLSDDVETAAVTAGGGADDADDWNRFFVRLHLVSRSKRDRSIEQIRKQLADQIDDIAGVELIVRPTSQMSISRMLSSGNGNVVVQIRGHNLDVAGKLGADVEKRMKKISGLINVKLERDDKRIEMAAHIDRAKAGLLGVSTSDITQTLETTIRGTDATMYREEGDEFNVLVRLQESDRERMKDIEQVGVVTSGGRVVPLKNLVSFRHDDAPVSIRRLDQQRVTRVYAEVEDRDLGSIIGDLQAELNEIPLPANFSFNIGGDWEQQQESFRLLSQGLVLAVLLMYMIMASQFESLIDPLLIMVTIPLGAIGVILMLVLTGTSLNVQSYIGVIMLAGIVVNNAIVLVDYIGKLRKAEPETEFSQIIIRAAVRRFRPILMTTLTTVLAMTPIALGWGEGGEMQAPMARVVIGGLISGTLITLLAIPLLAQAANRSKPSASAA